MSSRRILVLAAISASLIAAWTAPLVAADGKHQSTWHCAVSQLGLPQEDTYVVTGNVMHNTSDERAMSKLFGPGIHFSFKVLENDADALVAVSYGASMDKNSGRHVVDIENILIDKTTNEISDTWISLPATDATLSPKHGQCEPE